MIGGVRRRVATRGLRLLPPGSHGAGALVVAAVIVAVASSAHSAATTWQRLGDERHRYAPLPEVERRRAFIAQLGMPGDRFDYFADRVGRGDRVYFQVLPSGLGHFLDLPQAVAAVGRYYLLPAVHEPDVRRANVVVSWEQDPATLGVRYSRQHRSGVELVFVSRIAR